MANFSSIVRALSGADELATQRRPGMDKRLATQQLYQQATGRQLSPQSRRLDTQRALPNSTDMPPNVEQGQLEPQAPPVQDIQEPDGSITRGAVNSNHFEALAQDPQWSQQMQEVGISSWDDLLEPQKNIIMSDFVTQAIR